MYRALSPDIGMALSPGEFLLRVCGAFATDVNGNVSTGVLSTMAEEPKHRGEGGAAKAH